MIHGSTGKKHFARKLINNNYTSIGTKWWLLESLQISLKFDNDTVTTIWIRAITGFTLEVLYKSTNIWKYTCGIKHIRFTSIIICDFYFYFLVVNARSVSLENLHTCRL